MDPSTEISIHKAVAQRLEFTQRLAEWRESSSIAFPEITNRFGILLSIHYHTTALLVNRPLVTRLIAEIFPNKSSSLPFMGEIAIAIKQDVESAKELSQLVHCIAHYHPNFIDRNAIWWICNYSTFTAAVHLLGIVLICCQANLPEVVKVVELSEVREALVLSLDTLEMIERSSLMNRKGRDCLRRFLHVLDTLVLHPSTATLLDTTAILAHDQTETAFCDIFAQYISEPANDFILQLS
ncbi:hypothetical protein HBI17_197680 [Parastagonospora nodorum]|nr:hypothetical protein HBH52_223200 [Parastagonospora nodorum]KAH5708796.1 hypothetical protein HBI20_193570 [Parastagonospora nodorum]KAH5735632.1 hypothetical protein HBI17_197680 [Parastagonospora nodorum]KAH6151067.1 hypothetical protein HBI68_178630 [Parastagonospora nodorum]